MRPYSSLLLLVCLTMIACDSRATVKEHPLDVKNVKPPLDVKDAEDVRSVLRVKCLVAGVKDERLEKQREYLIRMGEKAFPAYEAILSDPKSESVEVCGVFGLIYHVKGDRRRFREYALARFTDSDYGVRRTAVWILGSIGSQAEASPVVALLSDDHTIVAYAAATTLAAIGGPNEVVAMDLWLRGVSYRDDAQLRQHVEKCRDDLKKRLDENRVKAPSKKIGPPQDSPARPQ